MAKHSACLDPRCNLWVWLHSDWRGFLAIWAKPSPGCLRVSIQLYWVQQWRRS